uniref:Uncharacterized protein n=1 Tax=Panagrolaimus sp. ES5 TaxID=591445 RepID=A0AC34FFC4_9BILA
MGKKSKNQLEALKIARQTALELRKGQLLKNQKEIAVKKPNEVKSKSIDKYRRLLAKHMVQCKADKRKKKKEINDVLRKRMMKINEIRKNEKANGWFESGI